MVYTSIPLLTSQYLHTHTHTHTHIHTHIASHHTSRAHRLNRVGPLATTLGISHRLSRNQHGNEETFTGLSATGRLPRGIVHDVQQELSTGSGVQLLREQPV